MTPMFKNWMIGTISAVILTLITWGVFTFLPYELSLLESWGLTTLMLVASSGVSIYNKG